MPIWGTILVALASSAVGGIAGSFLTTRMRITYDREESLRTRMLNAADDYSLRATHASNILHRVVNLVEPEDVFDEDGHVDPAEVADLRKACAEARPIVDEARAYFTRVQLLFGIETPTGRASRPLIAHLSHVLQVLDEPELDIDYARGVFREATEAHAEFTREARRALLRPSLQDPQHGQLLNRGNGN